MKLNLNFNKIVLVLILIICTVSFCGNFVYGKINETYKTSGEIGSIDVNKATVEAPILSSIAHFIYAIAGFIEDMVANIVSIFTGHKMFPWADRVIFNTMPLLDINFLSPEPGSLFLEKGTNTPTDLGNIVRSIYYTIFVLSVTFFGVVVGIMALKLAISSIAAEKAKYKQAITNWLLALILLFTAHYLMSFIFFVNEKMVEVASSVIDLQNLKIDTDVESMTNDEKEDVAEAVFEDALAGWSKDVYYDDLDSLIYYYPDGDLNLTEFRNMSDYEVDFNKDREVFNSKYEKMVVKPSLEKGKEPITKREWADMIWDDYYHGSEQGFLDGDFNNYGFSRTFYIIYNKATEFSMNNATPKERFDFGVSILCSEEKYSGYNGPVFAISIYDTSSEDKYGIYHFNNALEHSDNIPKNGTTDKTLREEWLTYVMRLYGDGDITEDINVNGEDDAFAIFIDAAYIMLLDKYYGLQDGKVTKEDFINGITHLSYQKTYYGVSKASDAEHHEKLWTHVQERYMSTSGNYEEEAFTGIAEFFKKSVSMVYLTEDEEGNKDVENFNSIAAILYSIFVIQSIMYFIAYLKRFFYILVMALFAPLVIIYDFLTKTAMG